MEITVCFSYNHIVSLESAHASTKGCKSKTENQITALLSGLQVKKNCYIALVIQRLKVLRHRPHHCIKKQFVACATYDRPAYCVLCVYMLLSNEQCTICISTELMLLDRIHIHLLCTTLQHKSMLCKNVSISDARQKIARSRKICFSCTSFYY